MNNFLQQFQNLPGLNVTDVNIPSQKIVSQSRQRPQDEWGFGKKLLHGIAMMDPHYRNMVYQNQMLEKQKADQNFAGYLQGESNKAKMAALQNVYDANEYGITTHPVLSAALATGDVDNFMNRLITMSNDKTAANVAAKEAETEQLLEILRNRLGIGRDTAKIDAEGKRDMNVFDHKVAAVLANPGVKLPGVGGGVNVNVNTGDGNQVPVDAVSRARQAYNEYMRQPNADPNSQKAIDLRNALTKAAAQEAVPNKVDIGTGKAQEQGGVASREAPGEFINLTQGSLHLGNLMHKMQNYIKENQNVTGPHQWIFKIPGIGDTIGAWLSPKANELKTLAVNVILPNLKPFLGGNFSAKEFEYTLSALFDPTISLESNMERAVIYMAGINSHKAIKENIWKRYFPDTDIDEFTGKYQDSLAYLQKTFGTKGSGDLNETMEAIRQGNETVMNQLTNTLTPEQ